MRSRSFLFRRFIAFLLGIAIAFSHFPTVAQSLNPVNIAECLAIPVCAAELGGAVKSGVVAGNFSGGVLGGAGAETGIAIVGGTAAAATTAVYGPDFIDAIRKAALDRWWADNPVHSSTSASSTMTFGDAGIQYLVKHTFTAPDGTVTGNQVQYTGPLIFTVGASQSIPGYQAQYINGQHNYTLGIYASVTRTITRLSPAVDGDWDNAPSDVRTGAAGTITDGEYAGGIPGVVAPVDGVLTPDGTLTPDDPFIDLPPGVLTPAGPAPGPTVVPNPDYVPSLPTPGEVANPDTPGWYVTPTGTFYWDGTQWKRPKEAPWVLGDPEPFPDPAPSPSPSPSPSPDPDADPDFNWPDTSPPDECPGCSSKESEFQGVPNFLTYAGTQLGNKFPFDVIGTFSYETSTCPELSVQGYNMELCFVSDSIEVLKFPVWFLFVLRMVTHL